MANIENNPTRPWNKPESTAAGIARVHEPMEPRKRGPVDAVLDATDRLSRKQKIAVMAIGAAAVLGIGAGLLRKSDQDFQRHIESQSQELTPAEAAAQKAVIRDAARNKEGQADSTPETILLPRILTQEENDGKPDTISNAVERAQEQGILPDGDPTKYIDEAQATINQWDSQREEPLGVQPNMRIPIPAEHSK